VRILCIKLEINQGYTMMHGQPIIKSYLPSFQVEGVSCHDG